jgi:phosphoribosylamine--glycine ligase
MKATAEGKLDKIRLSLNPKAAIATVVVAKGYPEDYRKGDVMQIPETEKDTIIFHAGTKLAENDTVVTNGGRVIVSVAMARTLNSARQKSQRLAKNIIFDGKYYRKDIGKDLLKYLKEEE